MQRSDISQKVSENSSCVDSSQIRSKVLQVRRGEMQSGGILATVVYNYNVNQDPAGHIVLVQVVNSSILMCFLICCGRIT